MKELIEYNLNEIEIFNPLENEFNELIKKKRTLLKIQLRFRKH